MPIIVDGYDPLATLRPNPDTDYAELAVAHYHLAQAAALDMQRLAEELLALREREAKGEAWLESAPTRQESHEHLLLAIRDERQHV